MIDMIDKFVDREIRAHGGHSLSLFFLHLCSFLNFLINKNREIYLSDPALHGYSYTDSLKHHKR